MVKKNTHIIWAAEIIFWKTKNNSLCTMPVLYTVGDVLNSEMCVLFSHRVLLFLPDIDTFATI